MRYLPAHSTAALGEEIAQSVAEAVRKKPDCVFGWPSGRTTLPVLAAIKRLPQLDLSRAVVVMMDDYAWENEGGFVNCDPDAHYSCHRWIREEWGAAIPPSHQPRFLVPSASDPAAYEKQIVELGGIDLFLVGLGATDGHVAFNPPGTPPESETRVVELAETTRLDNLHTFPEFRAMEEIPRYGVTVGLKTILSARRVFALAHGEHKADVVLRTLRAGKFVPDLPSTCLYLKDDCHLYVSELGKEIS